MPTLTRYEKHYLKIAMPAAFEGVLMILLGSADIIMVGSLGTAAVAAVSIFTQPRMALLCVARSMATAVSLLTAYQFGKNKKKEAGDVLTRSFALGAAVFAVLHVAFYFWLRDILLFMGATAEYLADAILYGRIALTAVFLTSLTAILQAAMLGFGQTAAVFSANIKGNAINIFVSAPLIFGIAPFPALGVQGAAIGTAAGAFCSFLLTLKFLRKENMLRCGRLLPDREFFREFLPVFGSVFCEQGFERIGMVVYTRMTAELGTVPYAVHAICMNFCDFYYSFAGGMGKAGMALAGQARGSNDAAAWQNCLRAGMKFGVVFSAAAFVVTFFLRDEIFSVYSADTDALALGGTIMMLVAAASFPEAHALVCAGVLRGSGKTLCVAVYSFVSVTVIRPLVTAFMLYELRLGLFGAWLALFLDQSMRAFCAHILVMRLRKKIRQNPSDAFEKNSPTKNFLENFLKIVRR